MEEKKLSNKKFNYEKVRQIADQAMLITENFNDLEVQECVVQECQNRVQVEQLTNIWSPGSYGEVKQIADKVMAFVKKETDGDLDIHQCVIEECKSRAVRSLEIYRFTHGFATED